MKGIEAKYTAKAISKMIAHNRKMDKKYRKRSERLDLSDIFEDIEESCNSMAVANFVSKETSKLSTKFRAFMISNAFKKNRNFTSAEVAYFNLGDNALNSLKEDSVAYSRYMDRFKRQQKAINIVRYDILEKNEIEQFNKWLEQTT